MKTVTTRETDVPVNPTSTNAWERRVEAWDYAGMWVKNTGAKTSCDIPSGGSGGASPLSLILGTP